MDGIIFAGYSMGTKLGTGLGSALVGWIIGMFGFVGIAEVQTSSALMSIRVVFSILPLVMVLVAAFCFLRINIEDFHEEIRADLIARNLR
jgi:GPH family glycoside/pentoside/hexuronide:cation symporter